MKKIEWQKKSVTKFSIEEIHLWIIRWNKKYYWQTERKMPAHTIALVLSHEKYVVKKLGSVPSLTLYSGTFGDKPSRHEASSM